MIKRMVAIASMVFLASCSVSQKTEQKTNTPDIVPIYGEYQPVKVTQRVIESYEDQTHNVVQLPVTIVSAATYWRDGYYVVPNDFVIEKNVCSTCLVNFVHADFVYGNQGITNSKIQWRERKDNEYLFSGWLGEYNVSYYAYAYDIAKPVTPAKLVRHLKSFENKDKRTLYTVNMIFEDKPKNGMPHLNNDYRIVSEGSPLFAADQTLVGMILTGNILEAAKSEITYIPKSEIEKDWAVFQKNSKK